MGRMGLLALTSPYSFISLATASFPFLFQFYPLLYLPMFLLVSPSLNGSRRVNTQSLFSTKNVQNDVPDFPHCVQCNSLIKLKAMSFFKYMQIHKACCYKLFIQRNILQVINHVSDAEMLREQVYNRRPQICYIFYQFLFFFFFFVKTIMLYSVNCFLTKKKIA